MDKGILYKKIKDMATYLKEGHPAFYLQHSEEKFDEMLKRIISNKDYFDRYDFYYYANYILKYMLNGIDSHTKVFFRDYKLLPLKIKIIDGAPYIIDSTNKYSQIVGSEIKGINGVPIKEVMFELSNIISSPSDTFLNMRLEQYLTSVNSLKSLPSINSSQEIKLNTSSGDISFSDEDYNSYKDKSIKPNYNLEIIDNGKTALITYNSCRDKVSMLKLINKLEEENNIKNYIVDLRGNNGGDSSINSYLVNFLEGKKVIVLSDEKVYSSARMCLVDLKNIGAIIIGKGPATSINCCGNNTLEKRYDDMNLVLHGSDTYWCYDNNYGLIGLNKERFRRVYEESKSIINPVFLNADCVIPLSLQDYLDKKDLVLELAVNKCKAKTNNRIL